MTKKDAKQYVYDEELSQLLLLVKNNPDISRRELLQVLKDIRGWIESNHEKWQLLLAEEKRKVETLCLVKEQNTKELKRQLQEERMRNGELVAAYDRMHSELDEAKNTTKVTQHAYDAVRSRLRNTQRELQTKRRPILAMPSPNKGLQRQVAKLEEEVEMLHDEVENIRVDAKDQLERHNDRERSLIAQIAELENKNKGLLGSFRFELEKERNKNAKLLEETKRLREQLDAKRSIWQRIKEFIVREWYRRPPWADRE